MSNANQRAYDVVHDRLEAAAVGLDIVKPFFDYHSMVLRVWANTCELLAHNYQRSVATFADDIKRSENHLRDAA